MNKSETNRSRGDGGKLSSHDVVEEVQVEVVAIEL